MTVEEYIKAYTKTCSNENVYGSHEPWLTPDHARAVVQIAKEDTINKVVTWMKQHGMTSHIIESFEKEMKNK